MRNRLNQPNRFGAIFQHPRFHPAFRHKAGVVFHMPPANSTQPEAAITGHTNPRLHWGNTSYIELVVDGEIVDLNRIALPADTLIIDERFKEEEKK